MNQSKFAILAGVSRAAVIKAIKTGKLDKDINKKIDDNCAKSLLYIRQQLEKSKRKNDKSRLKPVLQRVPADPMLAPAAAAEKLKSICEPGDSKMIDTMLEKTPDLLNNILKQAEKEKSKLAKTPVLSAGKKIDRGITGGAREKTPAVAPPVGTGGVETVDPDDDSRFGAGALYREMESKDDIDNEYKKANTEKIKVATAEKLGLLVPIDFVKKKFGKMAAVILNYFFPIGERLAPILCGICKITDPEIIKLVEIEISKEMTRGLAEFKKVATEDVKK